MTNTIKPTLPAPEGYRTRYLSEPGMLGHYPWTYADQNRRRVDRPTCEYEDLYTAEQMHAYADAAVAQERERCALIVKARADKIEAEAERCKFSEKDEVSGLRAMAWQLTVTEAAIRAGEPS